MQNNYNIEFHTEEISFVYKKKLPETCSDFLKC